MITMDETACWMDMPGDTTVHSTGERTGEHSEKTSILNKRLVSNRRRVFQVLLRNKRPGVCLRIYSKLF